LNPRKKALTLLETIVAMGLLGFLLVTLAVLFTRFLKTSDKSGDLTVGLQAAESLLQEAVTHKRFDSVGPSTMWLYTHDAGQPTQFTYRIDSTPKVLPGSSVVNSYYLDVHVAWSAVGAPNTAGRGRQEAHSYRLVSP
jgi:type II secretory pathway pseudopilin PulG